MERLALQVVPRDVYMAIAPDQRHVNVHQDTGEKVAT